MAKFRKTSVKLTDGRGQTMRNAGTLTLAATAAVGGINMLAAAPLFTSAAVTCGAGLVVAGELCREDSTRKSEKAKADEAEADTPKPAKRTAKKPAAKATAKKPAAKATKTRKTQAKRPANARRTAKTRA